MADCERGPADAIIVRDNKKPGENRAARVSLRHGRVTHVQPLNWNGDFPVDLEAIDSIPSSPGEFVALASSGRAFHIQAERHAVTVLGAVSLPHGADGDNYEGFALASIAGRLVAVWADRGQDDRPATVYAAEFDAQHLRFGTPQSQPFRAPFPTAHVRHASDLKVFGDGRIVVSSASDPGDDGPFESAIYVAGTVRLDGDALRLTTERAPKKLAEFPSHKVEALTAYDHGLLLGTDDENAGGSLRFGS